MDKIKKAFLIFYIVAACFFSFGQSTLLTMKKIPDTGQTNSYTSTFGEDNDYSIFPPFFIDQGNGTLTDTVTGLIWQKADGGDMTIKNALSYCDSLTLGGFNNWHLPRPLEAFSILNFQNANPALNTNLFIKTNAEYWWTCDSPYVNTGEIWCTNSIGGIELIKRAQSINAEGTKKIHARCVRDVSKPKVINKRFTDNGNGAISDNLTSLIWEQTPNPTSNYWEQALTYAENLTLAGFDDWRLPNIKELYSLDDYHLAGGGNGKIYDAIFKNMLVNKYWSSTSVVLPNQTSKAWYLSTSKATTHYDDKSNSNYFICVRGGQTTATLNNIKTKEIKVFPNPFTSKINLNKNFNNAIFELSNNFGQIIFIGSNIDSHDFSELPIGLYTLKIIEKSTYIIKLSKVNQTL